MIVINKDSQNNALEGLVLGLHKLAASDEAADLTRRIDMISAGTTALHILGEHQSIMNRLRMLLSQADIPLLAQDQPIQQSDFALLCIDATQPLGEQERSLLQKIRPLSFYLAIDSWAQLDDDARAEVQEWISQIVPSERCYYVDSSSLLGIAELIEGLQKAAVSAGLVATAALRSSTHARYHARRLRNEQQQARDIQRQIHDFGRALSDRLISDMYGYVASFDYDKLAPTALTKLNQISLLDASRAALPLAKQSELGQAIEAVFRSYVQVLLESWEKHAIALIQEDLAALEQSVHTQNAPAFPQNFLTFQFFAGPDVAEQHTVQRAIRAVLLGGNDWLLPTIRRLTLVAFSWILPGFMLRLMALLTLIISETRNFHEQEQRLKVELQELIQRSVRESIQDSLSIAALQSASLLDSQAFASRLQRPSNALDSFLYEQLHPEAAAQLAHNNQPALDELNAICRGPLLFSPDRFQHIDLSAELQATLQHSSDYYSSEDTARMNRLLLAEAYPKYIAPSLRDTLQQAVAALTLQIARPFSMPSGDIEALEHIQAAMQQIWAHAYGSAPSPEVLAAADQLWSVV